MTEQGPRSLTARRVAVTRHDIAVTALDLARQRGWDDVSAADLAAAADVSLRTFYRYFPRKQDVFVPLLEEATERLQQIFLTVDSDDLAYRSAVALEQSFADFPGGITAAHESYGTLLKNPALAPVWLFASLNAEPGFASVLRSVFPAIDDEHGGLLLAAVIITCQRVALQDWVGGPATEPLTPIAERAVRSGLQLVPSRL